jgi:DNA helicase HerA-like ATPase
MKKLGIISATEKKPNTCDKFTFWLGEDIQVSPFDVVKVENNIANKKTITYGMIEDINHITDSPGHISNFVSSDFGDIDAVPLTKKLALSYVDANVIHNSDENYMPVTDGNKVFAAEADDIKVALGLDAIDEEKAIPAGMLNTSSGVSVPIYFNGEFLIGPEGAHLNISGISGLATKTSYAMFLLKCIQQKNKDVAIIILNVKGDDLLRLNKPNKRITSQQKKEWDNFGVECAPFSNVRYFYPFKRGDSVNSYSYTSLIGDDLNEQFEAGIAKNFIYTYEHDKEKIDLLLSNIDDPNYTIESIINYIVESNEFTQDGIDWKRFKELLHDHTGTQTSRAQNREITVQSWRRFSRLISNSINNDIFINSISAEKSRNQVFLSNELSNISEGDVFVIDIAKLDEHLQCLVFGDVIKTIYELKHGESENRNTATDVPKKVLIFVDELNKYAPSSSKASPILNYLLEISERGRSEGVILFSAEQFKSSVHERIKGNCSTHIYGRTNAIEISKPDYKYIPNVYANMMNRLKKGDLIIQHPVFKTLLKISFPYPFYQQGRE